MDGMEKNFCKDVNDSLKLVFDITSRIDERMKILIENNNDSKDKIDKLYDHQSSLINRIIILENKNHAQSITDIKTDLKILDEKVTHLTDRCVHVEREVNQTKNKWASIVDFVFKIGVVVIGSIILWKLGIKP